MILSPLHSTRGLPMSFPHPFLFMGKEPRGRMLCCFSYYHQYWFSHRFEQFFLDYFSHHSTTSHIPVTLLLALLLAWLLTLLPTLLFFLKSLPTLPLTLLLASLLAWPLTLLPTLLFFLNLLLTLPLTLLLELLLAWFLTLLLILLFFLKLPTLLIHLHVLRPFFSFFVFRQVPRRRRLRCDQVFCVWCVLVSFVSCIGLFSVVNRSLLCVQAGPQSGAKQSSAATRCLVCFVRWSLLRRVLVFFGLGIGLFCGMRQKAPLRPDHFCLCGVGLFCLVCPVYL